MRHPDLNMSEKAAGKTINRFSWEVFKRLAGGKSLARILVNFFATQYSIQGDIIDLGSKSSSGSYHRALQFIQPYKIIHTDLYAAQPDVMALDLEQPFPLPDATQDGVLCFNVLEHLFNAPQALIESCRILKPGGRMIGAVPFFVGYHPDPHDYFRYTHEALRRMAESAGFEVENITALGLGPFTAGASLIGVYLPGLLRAICHAAAAPLDRLFMKLRKSDEIIEPLAYGFVFIKPDPSTGL